MGQAYTICNLGILGYSSQNRGTKRSRPEQRDEGAGQMSLRSTRRRVETSVPTEPGGEQGGSSQTVIGMEDPKEQYLCEKLGACQFRFMNCQSKHEQFYCEGCHMWIHKACAGWDPNPEYISKNNCGCQNKMYVK